MARMGKEEGHAWSWWGNRQHGKPGRRWEYNTTTGFQEMGGRGVKLIYLAQDRDM